MNANTKKLTLWVLEGIILLVLTFIILIAVNYFFLPAWLTDSLVLGILVLEVIVHCVIGVHKLRSDHTYRKKPAYTRPIDVTVQRHHYKKVNKKPIFVCALVVLLAAVVGFGSYKLLNHSKLSSVPEDVVEFGVKYPEAQDYVNNFKKYVNKDFDMDVSEEMSESDIPLFIQWDKRWGYKNYGENYVGVAGCGPTCMAMVVCGLEHDPGINPYVVALYSAEQGYYTYGEGTSWLLMTEGAEHYGLNVSDGNVSSDYILENLSSQTPMICSMGPGDFTTSGHFIVLTGIDDDGKIIVNDPNSPKNSSKHWDVDTLVSQMKNIWEYSY